MADLIHILSSQAGHFHNGAAVKAVLQHGASNFEFTFYFAFIAAFLFADSDTFKAPFLNAFLFQLLCNGHECVSVLRHALCQFANEGFRVS